MARAVIEILDRPWPDGREADLGLLAIDLDVFMDIWWKAHGAALRRERFAMAGNSTALAKRMGLSEDSYAYSVIRLRDAGLVTLRIETTDEEIAAGLSGETEQQ